MSDIDKDFKRMKRQLGKLIRQDLPRHGMEQAEELVQDAFDKEQYQGQSNSPKWQGRADSDDDQPRKERRGLLVQSGRLRASVEAEHQGSSIILTAGYKVGKWNLAEIHNEGLTPQPPRQFMPKPGEDFPEWDERIEKYLDDNLDRIFK